MLVHELIEELDCYDALAEIHMTARIRHGTLVTTINHVGYDKYGNLVVTFDDSLLKTEEKI